MKTLIILLLVVQSNVVEEYNSGNEHMHYSRNRTLSYTYDPPVSSTQPGGWRRDTGYVYYIICTPTRAMAMMQMGMRSGRARPVHINGKYYYMDEVRQDSSKEEAGIIINDLKNNTNRSAYSQKIRDGDMRLETYVNTAKQWDYALHKRRYFEIDKQTFDTLTRER